MSKEIMINAILKAVSVADGPVALAAAIDGVTYQAVQKWRRTGCPAKRVLDVEKATGVSRHELRPDLYPAEEKAA